MKKQHAWQKDVLKIGKITSESERGFNFSRIIPAQVYILCIIMLENMLNK